MASTVGVPLDLLDLLIDVLISSMNPLPLEALATEELSVTRIDGCADEKRIFLNMCLVHRTWTAPARRGLWHRTIFNAQNLFKLGISQITPNCPLIRELVLMASGSSEPSYWQRFVEILRHSPNLRKLYIDIEVENPAEPGFLECLRQLRMCSQLECLWFVGEMEGCYQEILSAVSYLPHLKSLVMDTVNSSDVEPDALQDLNPPKELKSVAVVDALDWEYFAWLIRPREDHNILNLSISLEDPGQLEEDTDSVELFYQTLALLETFHISTSSTDKRSEHAIHNECLGPLLARTRNLNCFTLTASSLRTSHINLPDTLIVLHIHHDNNLNSYLAGDFDSVRHENDRNIASVISEQCPILPSRPVASRLQKVVLSFTHDGRINDHVLARLRNEVFADTEMACLLAGITLSFETFASPYFGILAESHPFV